MLRISPLQSINMVKLFFATKIVNFRNVFNGFSRIQSCKYKFFLIQKLSNAVLYKSLHIYKLCEKNSYYVNKKTFLTEN